MINQLLLSAQPLVLLAESVSFTNELLIPFIISLILVAINGLFVAAEFSMLGSRPSRMEQLKDEGNERAGPILEVLESSSRQNSYLATAQLGITIVTLVLAMYGEPRIAHYLEATVLSSVFGLSGDALIWTGYVISISLLTYLHIVFGEMIPKAIALGDPSGTVIGLYRTMRWIERLFTVPIWILNGIGDMLLRVFRIPPEHGSARLYSSEEIEQIVSESTEGGLIAEEAEEMISNIFDFHDREVGQVMTPRRKVEGIPHDISYEQLLQQVTHSRHSRFPVYKEDLDHVVGILHLKDLVRHYRNGGNASFELESILRPTPIVPETHNVTDLLRALKLQRIHMAVVLDEYGGVAGIVTLEDLVEEIVGEVRDEFDVENEPYVEVEPGVIETSGDYLIDILSEDVYLGEEETIPNIDTVGGFVVTHLGRPPELGDVVTLSNDVTFTVIGIDGRAVSRVRIEYPTPEREDDPAEKSDEQ